MSSPEDFSEHDVLLQTMRLPEAYFDVQYTPHLAQLDFARLQLSDFVLQLLRNTAEFRSKALSYRGFKVAAGALGTAGNGMGRVLGFNVKFDETDRVNIHAEDLVAAKAEDAAFDAISVLSVIGPPQEDHASGRSMPTLHPCGRCRHRLSNNNLIQDDTLIVTATPDFTAIEMGTLADIKAAHDHPGENALQLFTYPKTPEVFSPITVDKRGFAVPVEIDDSDWQATVGQFLMARYILRQSRSAS